MRPVDRRFPTYTAAEAAADRMIHLLGVPAAVAAVSWLITSVGPTASVTLTITLLIYGFGLIGMLAASAAYNVSRPGRGKELLRRADHAMIFVMIAGSYTPFALNALAQHGGRRLCVVVWLLAGFGVALKLALPRRFERLSLLLYLGMGWSVLAMFNSFLASVQRDVFALLLLGGVAYSLGAAIHSLRRLPFHNPVWHALVLVGAGLHLAAISLQFATPSWAAACR
jgi:hemolysin III